MKAKVLDINKIASIPQWLEDGTTEIQSSAITPDSFGSINSVIPISSSLIGKHINSMSDMHLIIQYMELSN